MWAIPSLEVWINSEIPVQLFKPTEIVSVAQRLLLFLLSLLAFNSFSLTSKSFLAISCFHAYIKIFAFLNVRD